MEGKREHFKNIRSTSNMSKNKIKPIKNKRDHQVHMWIKGIPTNRDLKELLPIIDKKILDHNKS